VSVDDIFHTCRLPGWFVIHDGLTLAETFDLGVEMASKIGGLFVECYHFDAEAVDYEGFKTMLLQETLIHEDVLIVNFSVRIAHQWDKGGGHFSIVSLVERQGENDEDLLVTISDVHPMKYGKSWTCSSRHLFDAMVDKDSESRRARGMIRIGLHTADRRPHNLRSAQKSVCYCDPALDEKTRKWLARFAANFPPEKFEMVVNMAGCCASSLALTGLMQPGPFNIVDPDDLMWELKTSYINTLRNVSTVAEVETFVNRYVTEIAKVPIKAEQVLLGGGADDMLAMLVSTTGPAGDGKKHSQVVLVLTDINIAMGTMLIYVDPKSEAAKLSHLAAHWCVVVAANKETRAVTIADPRARITTRLWNASVDQLWSGCRSMKAETMVAVTMTEDVQ